MFKNILMPTDGSEHSEKAIERGVELGRLCGAKITGLHAMPNLRLLMGFDDGIDPIVEQQMEKDAASQALHFLQYVQKTAVAAGLMCETVVATNDHPYDAIVDTANQHGCDLIVMTSRYRPGLVSLLMGNETDRVLHRASIPVLTFRALMSADHPDHASSKWHDWWHRKVTDSAGAARL
jgi:nucleotide-binding universal stress UspA family protein